MHVKSTSVLEHPRPSHSHILHLLLCATFVFDGVEANRLPVSPQQFAALCAGVQGEQRLLLRGPLHHLTEQEHNHPLHDRLHLGRTLGLRKLTNADENKQRRNRNYQIATAKILMGIYVINNVFKSCGK